MRRKPSIALIADEFTQLALTPEAEIIHLTPHNWRWQLLAHKTPDMLFVESAWRGYGDRWKGKLAQPLNCPDSNNINHARNTINSTLINIVQWFKQRRIPTLFWNKEDPISFARFKDVATLFDVIYTTDCNSEANYRSAAFANTQFVGTLPFAVQPKLFYCDNRIHRLPNIVFAGGFYGDEYPQRSQQQQQIMTSLKDQSLLIYDRFWQHGKPCSFPNTLIEHCKPSVKADKTAALFRQYQLYLNFNTVSDSATMLSRRVFEIAACGGVIISTPSPALTHFFEQEIPQVTNGIEAAEWSQRFFKDTSLRINTGKRLHDSVMAKHTWRHRLEQISRETGIF